MRRFAWWVWLHLWMLLWPARRDQERLRIRLLREAEGLARNSDNRAMTQEQVEQMAEEAEKTIREERQRQAMGGVSAGLPAPMGHVEHGETYGGGRRPDIPPPPAPIREMSD